MNRNIIYFEEQEKRSVIVDYVNSVARSWKIEV